MNYWHKMTEASKQKRRDWRKSPEQRAKANARLRKWLKTHKVIITDHRREYRRKWTRENDIKRREIINRFKMKPCMDCGIQYNPWVMDFDHRAGEVKVECVGTMFRNHRSFAEMQKEISKCDVVCSNCHRERTHKTKWARKNV